MCECLSDNVVVLTRGRMDLEWSVVQFAQSQYIVCEDVEQLAVNVVRSGQTNQSVRVNIRAKPLSAKENLDYISSTNNIVEFLPG